MWGLGIGDWGLGIGPNPQSPIPNPQSPIPIITIIIFKIHKINLLLEINNFTKILKYNLYNNSKSELKIFNF